MAQHIHGDTRHKIKVDFAIAIPDARAFAAHKRQWLAFKCALIILVLQRDPVAFVCFR